MFPSIWQTGDSKVTKYPGEKEGTKEAVLRGQGIPGRMEKPELLLLGLFVLMYEQFHIKGRKENSSPSLLLPRCPN